MTVTFVSAYYTLENTPYFNAKPEEWDPWPILDLLNTGIHLCLYIGPNCAFESLFESWTKDYPHFRIMPYRVYYQDMFVYKAMETRGLHDLPANRNLTKDTLEYLVYMHARTEVMEDAISENPWDSTHFAWIDFNVSRLFRKKDDTLHSLFSISEFAFPPSALYISGCWPEVKELDEIATTICWRFCGGFFLGDVRSITRFAELCREKIGLFLDTYKRLTWEVNFWAFLEKTQPEKLFTWFRGDHNDTLIHVLPNISADTYTAPLENMQSKEYVYPFIQDYWAGSASYVRFVDGTGKERHLMNTRFVNYWMYPNGYYRFLNKDMVIENKNLVSELDADTLEPMDYREFSGVLLDREGCALARPAREKRTFSEGLEDVRLFLGKGGEIRFIATNVDYSPVGRNRMILGTYDYEDGVFRDCQVVVPPDSNSWCEKNWIPVVAHSLGQDLGQDLGRTFGQDLGRTFGQDLGRTFGQDPIVDLVEYFIYKWSPFELGVVNPTTSQLEIVRKYEPKSWIFQKLRGSTTFSVWPEDPDYIVGVAHFSEEHGPRHYYHLLVLLEKTTLKPVKYSRTFCFEKLSIEFCLGFSLDAKEYVFWISRFDRDPLQIRIPRQEIMVDKEVMY
jgi:hypothetical protein